MVRRGKICLFRQAAEQISGGGYSHILQRKAMVSGTVRMAADNKTSYVHNLKRAAKSVVVVSHARLNTCRDDGVIDPADTRRVLGLALAAATQHRQLRHSQSSYGVFRF